MNKPTTKEPQLVVALTNNIIKKANAVNIKAGHLMVCLSTPNNLAYHSPESKQNPVFLMLVSAGCMLQGYGLAGLGFFFVAYMLCYVAAKRLNGLSSVIKYKQDRGEM
jgi:hypothetical protein